jgi:hypothetical protein
LGQPFGQVRLASCFFPVFPPFAKTAEDESKAIAKMEKISFFILYINEIKK